MATDCIFCKILAGQIPSSFVYRDELCAAFMDIRPVNPGHLLVIPAEHAEGLRDLPEKTGGHLFEVGQQLAAALRGSGVRCEGVNLYLADGKAAGQEVFHVHLHVVPRFAGDGTGFRFRDSGGGIPADLGQIAGKIKGALAQRESGSGEQPEPDQHPSP